MGYLGQTVPTVSQAVPFCLCGFPRSTHHPCHPAATTTACHFHTTLLSTPLQPSIQENLAFPLQHSHRFTPGDVDLPLILRASQQPIPAFIVYTALGSSIPLALPTTSQA